MPHVIVKLWPGKSEQQKTRLAEKITKDVMEVLNYGDESVSVAMEISIRGQALRQIETAMQRLELSFLAALSGNHRSLIPDGQPAVIEIFVEEFPCASMHSNVPQE